MKPHLKKNLCRMVIGFTAYGFGFFTWLHFYTKQSSHSYWLVLLPVLPLLYVATVIIRSISYMDEMWRKILTEAMAFSAIATGFTCISYVFIRISGAPEFHAEWAFYMIWIYYLIGTFISWRRYK